MGSSAVYMSDDPDLAGRIDQRNAQPAPAPLLDIDQLRTRPFDGTNGDAIALDRRGRRVACYWEPERDR